MSVFMVNQVWLSAVSGFFTIKEEKYVNECTAFCCWLGAAH